MVLFCVSISPESVGAYRIRPDVGEQEMTAASIPSLKACPRSAARFFHQFHFEQFPCLPFSPSWRAYALAPLHNYHLFVEDTVMDGVNLCKYFAGKCRGVSHTP